MQAVPSLIGSGSAIAAAASGLVFGQPAHPNPPTTRSGSHQRTISADRLLESSSDRPARLLPSLGPSTTTAPSPAPATVDLGPSTHTSSNPTISRPPLSRYQRPSSAQLVPPRSAIRSRSSASQAFAPAPSAIPGSPDSTTPSHGSWIRRLSVRPLSQQGSARSSTIPDSSSFAVSQSSAAPILAHGNTSPTPTLPPNKLVKRAPSTSRQKPPEPPPRRWPKTHLPTLRRPATSHQRSATLQQLRADVDVAGAAAYSKFSFERSIWPEELPGTTPANAMSDPAADAGWASFLHSRTFAASDSTTLGPAHGRPSDASPFSRPSTSKRICLESDQMPRVHLVKPRMITLPVASDGLPARAASRPTDLPSDPPSRDAARIAPVTSVRTKRSHSLSSSFASAGNWVSKTSDSLRRPKRGADRRGGSKRHVSDPVAGSQSPPKPERSLADKQCKLSSANIDNPSSTLEAVSAAPQPPLRQRNLSSPPLPFPHAYPPSVFHEAWPRPGPPPVAETAYRPRPSQPSGSSTSSAALSQLRGSHYERCSVMESSDGDGRGFASGDDDDTDFKSDTVFDSLRTLASNRAKAVETPLESVYDESPPGTSGNGCTRRLPVQEILDRSWDDDDKILEEDEHTPTPVRKTVSSFMMANNSAHKDLDARPSPRLLVPPSVRSLHDALTGTKSMESCASPIEDEDDEDWTRDLDGPLKPSMSLPKSSPPLRAGGLNPNIRLALASIGQPTYEGQQLQLERPVSNLFHWSEPLPQLDETAPGGGLPRPRTAFSRPEMKDPSRGGRSSIRKGPAPAHVRSQSVPIVYEVADDSKQAGSKYGTWGLGTKAASEDWDDDFEFGGGSSEGNNANPRDGGSFAVPESIRATQPSVKAHSGQIRELSLLVNDLKRLCRHGRNMDMLSGEDRGLWEEAEGIIALASPDEEDEVKGDDECTANSGWERADQGAALGPDGGGDGDGDGHQDAASPPAGRRGQVMKSPEAAMSKTAVVRERPSPRRRSVFSPDDDVFCGPRPAEVSAGPSPRSARAASNRSATPERRTGKARDVTGVVRSVVDSMQQGSCQADAVRNGRSGQCSHSRVHFDTNSLKALVRRAGELRDALSEIVRRAEQLTQSPARTPRHERHPESSPAFTRMFDDPGSSPPRPSTKGREMVAKSAREGTSSETSSPMSRRVPMMTVG